MDKYIIYGQVFKSAFWCKRILKYIIRN
uniref:Uncharacterized protein n=1 Tax=Anguilla anguilla TaxID=7936 RepID=A0A0E9TXT0_ANGAN